MSDRSKVEALLVEAKLQAFEKGRAVGEGYGLGENLYIEMPVDLESSLTGARQRIGIGFFAIESSKQTNMTRPW